VSTEGGRRAKGSVDYAIRWPRDPIVGDGCGFDIESIRSGTGLRLIRERSQRPGVQAEVSSVRDSGTRVQLSLRTG
jgi:nitrate/nitrite-specific signal transduction histidine kinase